VYVEVGTSGRIIENWFVVSIHVALIYDDAESVDDTLKWMKLLGSLVLKVVG
jgi:hypothetical protein